MLEGRLSTKIEPLENFPLYGMLAMTCIMLERKSSSAMPGRKDKFKLDNNML